MKKINRKPSLAELTIWGVVNVVNVLQTAGFISRIVTGSMTINHFLGYILIALAIPAALALFAFVRGRAGWLQYAGPAVYLAFITFMGVVDYAFPIEFRNPVRSSILVPYLVLFFGAIFLMGFPMFRLNRRLWLVAVVTSVLLLVSMIFAMSAGVG